MSRSSKKGSKRSLNFPVRVDLDEDDANKFQRVQELFKLKNKAEVLRFCVNKVYFGTTLDLDPAIQQEIEKITSSHYIKVKYAITSVDDFIKRAIADFLETLKQDRSLKNWGMRQSLNEEENEVAVAILELQLKKAPGVTVFDIQEYLSLDEESVSVHLNKFISDGLLDFRETREKIYYYAP